MSKVKATYGGFVQHEGVPVLLAEGEERDTGDSLVLARPELFTQPEPEPESKPSVQPEPRRRSRVKDTDG